MSSQALYEQVHDHYGAAARTHGDANTAKTIAKAFGYSEEELRSVPAGSNLGVSCGNPLALASLRPGETVVDLGCGAGFDVFLAAGRVKPNGKVIGVDMNRDMLNRAEVNLAKSEHSSHEVSFVESRITTIDLASGSVDCIISNCVINLVPEPDKHLVFQEMYRLLKSGGRVAVSDVLAKKELPENIRNSMALYVGCLAGASSVLCYERYLREAGFQEFSIVNDNADLNIYHDAENKDGGAGCCISTPAHSLVLATESSACCSASAAECAVQTPATDLINVDWNEWAGSFKIYATKT